MPRLLDSTGLQVKTLSEIRTDIQARLKASISPTLRFEAGGVLNNIVDALAKEIITLDEALLAIWNAFILGTSEGASLDNLASLVGVDRNLATRSTGEITATGVAATFIPSGSRVRVPEGPYFRTTQDATIGGGGTVDIPIESVDTGVVVGLAATITEIVDAVVGWSSVSNTDDAITGRELESDFEFRARIYRALQSGTTATDQAIRTAVEQVANVLAAIVVSNRSLVTDADGIPGKAFRTVVWPDTVDVNAVARAIWDTMPAGILPHGTDNTVTFTDDQGYAQDVSFDWSSAVELYLEIDVTRDAAIFPPNGEDLVKAYVDLMNTGFAPNEDFLPLVLKCLVLNIPGVRDVAVRVGLTVSPTQTTPFSIALDEIAELDSAARTTIALL